MEYPITRIMPDLSGLRTARCVIIEHGNGADINHILVTEGRIIERAMRDRTSGFKGPRS